VKRGLQPIVLSLGVVVFICFFFFFFFFDSYDSLNFEPMASTP
jgi:hypothetical protein